MLGISFGTSIISCAFVGEGIEQPKIVGQPESSCIFFNRNKDAIFVGKRAEMWKLSNQGQAIYDFKRLIGQIYSHESVVEWQKAVPNVPIKPIFGGKPVFEIVQNGENKIKGTEQIIAQILTKIRQQAEQILYDDLVRMFQPILQIEDVHLQNVVLTVPASFKMAQKRTIEEAAAIAGFEQIQLVEESFAAGLGFVHENPRFSGILLVFNFGAGFLDISILNVIDDCKLANFMENKRIEILGMAGDDQLGGLDIDAKIAEHFAVKIGQRFPDMDLMGNTKLMHKLRMKCKELKEKIFTFNEDICLEMDELELDEEELTMTIQELEEICAPICEKAIQILMRLLKNTELDGLRLHNISKVLLTGGTSRIPLIKKLLMENGFAEQKLCTNFDMGIAAKGAAIFGSKLGKMLSPNCGQLFHGLDCLLPMHSKFIVLFPPGTSFPTGFTTSSTVPISCQTSEDGQSCIRLEFYECGEFVASVSVDGLPPESKAGTVKVDLEIGLTRNGLPHVECLQISYPTNSNAFRVRPLPLEFGHFHGCKLPSSSNDEMSQKLIYDEEMKENIPPQNPKFENTVTECPICFNEFARNEHRIFCEPIYTKEVYSQKWHSICAQCVIQNATISMHRASALGGAGLPCMATKCTNVLTLAQMRQILPEDVLERFEELAIEYSIEDVDKLERCTNCNFRMIVESNSAEMPVFRCPECNYEFCRKCKFPWNKEEHFGRSCEQLEEAERERIRLEEERIRLEEERRSHEERMEKLRRETEIREKQRIAEAERKRLEEEKRKEYEQKRKEAEEKKRKEEEERKRNEEANDGTRPFTFIWPFHFCRNVGLQGSWDGWKRRIEMERNTNGNDGFFHKMKLKPGYYEFQFFVDNARTTTFLYRKRTNDFGTEDNYITIDDFKSAGDKGGSGNQSSTAINHQSDAGHSSQQPLTYAEKVKGTQKGQGRDESSSSSMQGKNNEMTGNNGQSSSKQSNGKKEENEKKGGYSLRNLLPYPFK